MKEKPIRIKNGSIQIDTYFMSKVDHLIRDGKIVKRLLKNGGIKRLTPDSYFEFKDWGTAKNFIRKDYLPTLKKEVENQIYYLNDLQMTKRALEEFLERY